ncbi:exopolysaccharide biosynthesis protein [Halomonas kalidii]|uniref:Exopolysaccharide biosynthesis protein n=1 Tax=Halomonas kalidii TaxID=3043293 RepID=A0ABT6VQ22_9GAMM|nr:exopolysaccharide biosynthesis protein [Halomonas kalidii]MDI5935357.1 exopolysaccharide biosynthesis protein [Halomonas kalidii]
MPSELPDEPPHECPTDLTGLLALMQRAGERETSVSLDTLLDSVGRRSFAPFLLLAGLITLAPVLGDIPGVPTLMALLVVLSATQLLVGRDHVWLPRWLLQRRVARERFVQATRWMERPASWVDRLIKPRLTWLTRPPAHLPVALTCLLIALAMPPMEVVPFSATGAGLALTLFGLALLANDGLLALLGYLLTAGTLGVVVTTLA